jgi:hypothetical protein
MADGYVCFADDTANENFFIFAESKVLRELMIADGTFTKLPKNMQAKLKQDWLIMRGYAKGVAFDSEEYFDKDGGSCHPSYNVAAVTSTVCDTASMSWIVTRQERIAIARKYHIRLFFAIVPDSVLSSRVVDRRLF